MRPFLEEVDKGEVEFISVESKSKLPMKIFRCAQFSLIQVEAARRSSPCSTYVVENPRMTTFPLLLDIQTMSDMDLAASFRTGVVRDPLGQPYRLYNRKALGKLLAESLKVLTRKWSNQRVIPRKAVTITSSTGAVSSMKASGPPVKSTEEGSRTRDNNGGSEGSGANTVKPAAKAGTTKVQPWSKGRLHEAEHRDDHQVFAECCLYHLDELQRFLIRHPLDFQREFSKLFAYVQYRKSRSPFFSHRWDSLWRQRKRWANKPSLRMKKYPVIAQRGPPRSQHTTPPLGRASQEKLAQQLQTLCASRALPLKLKPTKVIPVTPSPSPERNTKVKRLDKGKLPHGSPSN